MKILKVILGVLGVVGLGVGGYFLFQAWLELRNLWSIANSMRSTTSVNPTPTVMIAASLGAIGGLALGLALGLPGRTRSAIRRQALQDASDAREAAIRQRVGTKDLPASEDEERR
jgi:hypothetical protein